MSASRRDHVLVVDDDPDLCDLCEILCADWGLTVLGAESCEAALRLLEREHERLRVVLLDYFMPGPPPLERKKAIQVRLDPGVPIVLVSAATDIAERARELGLARYLGKPFEVDALRAAVGG
jgi:two-component system, NtrC family, response regulator PilR